MVTLTRRTTQTAAWTVIILAIGVYLWFYELSDGVIPLIGVGKSTKIPPSEVQSVENNTSSAALQHHYNVSSYDYNSRRETYRKEMEKVIRDLLLPSKAYNLQQESLGYAKGLSMLSKQQLEGLVKQVESVVDAKIDGDVYEFGSWRGGASILMARAFEAYEKLVTSDMEGEHRTTTRYPRTFWVFDTFDGFSDNQVGNDTLLQDLLLTDYWVAPLDKVRQSFVSFTSEEFVQSHVRFIPGLFEESLPRMRAMPNGDGSNSSIALLRLDGDLYESTKVVLDYMYSSLVRGGHVIVDDYDWRPENWDKTHKNKNKVHRKICKDAVDNFRRQHGITSKITRQYGRPSWIKDEEELL